MLVLRAGGTSLHVSRYASPISARGVRCLSTTKKANEHRHTHVAPTHNQHKFPAFSQHQPTPDVPQQPNRARLSFSTPEPSTTDDTPSYQIPRLRFSPEEPQAITDGTDAPSHALSSPVDEPLQFGVAPTELDLAPEFDEADMYTVMREKLATEIPPFDARLPKGVVVGDVIEIIKKGVQSLRVVSGFEGLKTVLALAPGFDEPSKVPLMFITFRFPRPTTFGVNQLVPSVEEIPRDTRKLIDRIALRAEDLWKAMLGREKVTAQDAMEFLFGPADKLPLKEVQFRAMYNDVPILHLYAAHCVLIRNPMYFGQKTAGVFTCNPTALVEQIKKEKQALNNRDMVNKFVAAVQRKLFSKFDHAPIPVNSRPDSKFHKSTPPVLPIYTEDIWDLRKYPLLISALERYAYTSYRLGITDKDVIDKLLHPLQLNKDAAAVVSMLDSIDVLEPKHNLPLRRVKFEGSDALEPFPTTIKEAYDPKLMAKAADPDKKTRKDLRKLLVYTVDSPSTVEIDDGFSIEYGPDQQEFILVHIADPTRWMLPNSQLDLAARKRVSTLYLQDSTVPMFPHEVARDVMSILPGTPSHALTFKFSLDKEGGLKTYEIFPSMLMNIVRTNYDAVDKILDGSGAEEPMLHRLYEHSLMRRKWREHEGAYVTNYPKSSASPSGNKINLDFGSTMYSKAQILVSELMIVTGEIAARYAVEHNIPVPFRVQPPPQVESEDYAKFLRSMPPIVREHEYISLATRATASATPASHFGVGLKGYARSSSPIRRYYDMLVHYQIKAHLRGKKLPFTEENIAEVIKETAQRESEIIFIQRAVTNMWVLKYLKQEHDKTYTGVVLRVREKDLRVLVMEAGYTTTVERIYEPLVEGVRHAPQMLPVSRGDRLALAVKSVDQFQANFEVIPPNDPRLAQY